MRQAKTLLCAALVLMTSVSGWARVEKNFDLRDTDSWAVFDQEMQEAEHRDRTEGISYLVSGALVTLGGVAGAEKTDDTATKLIFGLTEGLGIAGIGYGFGKLSLGNEYSSFYESLRQTNLTALQRDNLVRAYMEREREKRATIRKISLVSHLLAGALNVYSASREKDANTKSFFEFFAGLNFALALSYTF